MVGKPEGEEGEPVKKPHQRTADGPSERVEAVTMLEPADLGATWIIDMLLQPLKSGDAEAAVS